MWSLGLLGLRSLRCGAALFLVGTLLWARSDAARVSGITKDAGGEKLYETTVTAHNVDSNTDLLTVSKADGTYVFPRLEPGNYEIKAAKDTLTSATAAKVTLSAGQNQQLDITLAKPAKADPSNAVDTKKQGFWKRFTQAYADDWKGSSESTQVPRRGYPNPTDNPPFPFTDWPYGGSPVIGTVDTSLFPLMQALYEGPHGDAWKRSRIKIYGWLNGGFNVSSSDRGKYANAPAAYYQLPDSVQLDQATLYIERVPDEAQTDHFDWGFRLTNLYGLDYRFTTAKGYFSNQLLGKNNTYGYDPVMAYVDLYFPHVAQGMNVRIGRYISLPDIEAQLAVNNYTYSHSLLYSFDAYTQTGINATIKLSDRWMVQVGVSAGNDVAPWTKDAKATLNVCGGYTWADGGDNIYLCANSINDGKYAYNNVQAYYATWYHKFGHTSWHTATEAWYMYEKDVPSIFGTVPTETNGNGAWCPAGQQTCYAPEFAIVNYVEKQVSKSDFFTIRNEFFNDIRGQRTGYQNKYSEHLIGWSHFIGSTVILRPELRYEHAYDNPAYDSGTKRSQFVFAADAIFRF